MINNFHSNALIGIALLTLTLSNMSFAMDEDLTQGKGSYVPKNIKGTKKIQSIEDDQNLKIFDILTYAREGELFEEIKGVYCALRNLPKALKNDVVTVLHWLIFPPSCSGLKRLVSSNEMAYLISESSFRTVISALDDSHSAGVGSLEAKVCFLLIALKARAKDMGHEADDTPRIVLLENIKSLGVSHREPYLRKILRQFQKAHVGNILDVIYRALPGASFEVEGYSDSTEEKEYGDFE